MPWYIPIPESWKKRACRYLLQRYVGHFLKEKLSLDQLSLDLFSGRGTIKELNLDVEALNESLESVNAPLEIIDGFIGSISIAIPWSSLLSDSMEIEVKNLELTIQLKECDENDAFLNTASMFSSMTSSLQLAEEVLHSDKTESSSASEPFEGVEMFAQTIDSVLSRVKLSFVDSIVRLEHMINEDGNGIALELRIDRIDYYDDLAKVQGSPVDECNAESPTSNVAEATKNFHLMGVTFYWDEFTKNNKQDNDDNVESVMTSTNMMYESASSSISSFTTEKQSDSVLITQPQSTVTSSKQPVKIAVMTGQQIIKVKVKQNESLSGPKVEVNCQLGAIFVLLSPYQVHGLIDILSNINSQATSTNAHSKKKSTKNKVMDSSDYRRVENELQKHLHAGRLQPNEPQAQAPNEFYTVDSENMLQSIDDLNDERDEVYFSMHAGKSHGLSEMEISSSSINTTSSNQTCSTATTYPQSDNSQIPRKRTSSKPKDNLQKLLDDPVAEVSNYNMKISFISINILHENMENILEEDDQSNKTNDDKLNKIYNEFFQQVSRITFSGVNVPMKSLRDKFSKVLLYDHIGFLGKPLTISCMQKIAPKHRTMSVDMIIGMAELVEFLYDRRNNTSPLNLLAEPKLIHYTELLTFSGNDVSTTSTTTTTHMPSLHDTVPAFKLHFVSGEKKKISVRNASASRSKIHIDLGQLQCEVDITIIDRITTLLNTQTSTNSNDGNNLKASCYYNQQYNSMLFNQAMDETPQERIDLSVSSQSATLHIRFPKPDLRSSAEKMPWWQRNLHKEMLILELRNFKFTTELHSGTDSSKLEFMCSDILCFFPRRLYTSINR